MIDEILKSHNYSTLNLKKLKVLVFFLNLNPNNDSVKKLKLDILAHHGLDRLLVTYSLSTLKVLYEDESTHLIIVDYMLRNIRSAAIRILPDVMSKLQSYRELAFWVVSNIVDLKIDGNRGILRLKTINFLKKLLNNRSLGTLTLSYFKGSQCNELIQFKTKTKPTVILKSCELTTLNLLKFNFRHLMLIDCYTTQPHSERKCIETIKQVIDEGVKARMQKDKSIKLECISVYHKRKLDEFRKCPTETYHSLETIEQITYINLYESIVTSTIPPEQ